MQEIEKRRGIDPMVLPVTRTASGPSTVSTPQDHGNDDGSEQCAEMRAEDPVRLPSNKSEHNFKYDQPEEGDAGMGKSQVSYGSLPTSSEMSSQPHCQESLETNTGSSQFVAASSDNSYKATIISSNSDQSGNSNPSSLSPPVRGSRYRKSSNSKEEKKQTILISPLQEEQLEDKNENEVETSETARHKMATDKSPVASPKSDRRAEIVDKVATDVLPGSSTKSDGVDDIVKHKVGLPAPSPKCEEKLYLTEKQTNGMQAGIYC